MDVDDSSKTFPLSVPGDEYLGPTTFTLSYTVGSPCGQPLRDGVQDVHIALEGVVESRCIDQHNWTIVHRELFGNLDFLRTRVEVTADVEVRLACEIDELGWLRVGR